jgi:hypothetical protein
VKFQTKVPAGCPETAVKVIPDAVAVADSVDPAELVATTVRVLAVPAGAVAGETTIDVMLTVSLVTITEPLAEAPEVSLTFTTIVALLISSPNKTQVLPKER